MRTRDLFNLNFGILSSTIGLVLLLILQYFPISYIIGSVFGFFSLHNIVTPLLALFGGMWFTGAIMALKTLFLLAKGKLFGAILVNTLPGLCANAYWIIPPIIGHLVLPIACIAAFLAHPVGYGAGFYTLYWLVPIIVYGANFRSFYARALSSTFVAHAVGSVLWLYLMTPMISATWIGMIPVVFFERVMLAAGMTMVYYAVCSATELITQLIGHSYPSLNKKEITC
jgi:hypothetical protein